ncbi:MAG: aminodeoxychorismate/anthranilate synthase component II [Paenibacillaceae bacterium]|jgi:para-aminobenzoate synthetase component 2|nr:aminodeoxychorismate/anthranilate synthase component II [Paenibacillaceae bacterium]
MIVVIDNYDSFTYNIVQYVGVLGRPMRVFRNDEIDPAGIADLQPTHIILSPGPCSPKEAGITIDVVRTFQGHVPMLGVCLGHQAIGEAFGGEVVRAERQLHGKVSPIYHDGQTMFHGIPSPFIATRYHSLIVRKETCPPELRIVAHTEEGEIMALRHTHYPIEGVQFHPESIMTEHGLTMLHQFVTYYDGWGTHGQRMGSA